MVKRICMVVALLGTTAAWAQGGEWFNQEAKLRAYPNAQDVRVEQEGKDSEVEFRTGDSVKAVFDHYDKALTGNGWKRVDQEVESDEIEAKYQREGQKLDVEVEQKGEGRIHIDFDFDQ